MNREQIKAEAKARGLKVPDLIVLAPQRDPFYIGTPSQREKGEWFAGLYESEAIEPGYHLRRIHYRWSDPGSGVLLPSGEPYLNDRASWTYLEDASRYARLLHMIPADELIDRQVRRYVESVPTGENHPDPAFTTEWEEWDLPEIDPRLSHGLDDLGPGLGVEGYLYREDLQGVITEVWVEKSSVEAEMVPLCTRYGANLTLGRGNIGITSVVRLLAHRVIPTGKPARVLYVSDFDMQGSHMPTAVSRQLQYWCGRLAPDADVRVEALAITAEQIEEYGLQRAFIPDDKPGKAAFEAAHGEGAVEIESLVENHPGALEEIVGKRLSHYRDAQLPHKVLNARWDAESSVEAALKQAAPEAVEALEQIKFEAADIVGSYEERLEALAGEMAEEMGPLKARLEDVRQAVSEALEGLEPVLPDVPKGKADPDADDRYWLFDSGRGYEEQTEHLLRRKRG